MGEAGGAGNDSRRGSDSGGEGPGIDGGTGKDLGGRELSPSLELGRGAGRMSLVPGPMELSGRGGGTGGVSDNRRAAPGSGLCGEDRLRAGRGGAAVLAGRPGGRFMI